MAITRFQARRGNVREIWSDNGSNFKAADKELQGCLRELDQAQLTEKLGLDGIKMALQLSCRSRSWWRLGTTNSHCKGDFASYTSRTETFSRSIAHLSVRGWENHEFNSSIPRARRRHRRRGTDSFSLFNWPSHSFLSSRIVSMTMAYVCDDVGGTVSVWRIIFGKDGWRSICRLCIVVLNGNKEDVQFERMTSLSSSMISTHVESGQEE